VLHWCDCLDDDQLSTATRARQGETAGRLNGIAGAAFIDVLMIWRLDPEQSPDPGDVGDTVAIAVETIVSNVVLAFWQDVDQEPADEL